MEDTKGALKSGTVLASSLGSLSSFLLIAQSLGEVVQLVKPEVLAIVTAVTSLISIFKRVKASTKIKGLF